MDLTGQLLIAMPGMGDPRFARSVVYLCAYSDEGAMGLMVNKPASDVTLRDVLDRMDMPFPDEMTAPAVHVGGPVETERGFVLHSDEYRGALHPLVVPGGFALTATQDILEDIAKGEGPDRHLFALGYAGWGSGQLEQEIASNGWLTAPATLALVFDTPDDDKWDAALRSIGIDPVSLSGAAGRA